MKNNKTKQLNLEKNVLNIIKKDVSIENGGFKL